MNDFSSPDDARLLRGLDGGGGGDLAVTLGPGVTTTTTPGGPPAGSLVICASSIDDMASPGICIPASSVPTLGMLYPISTDLFVDAGTGNVGVLMFRRIPVDG